MTNIPAQIFILLFMLLQVCAGTARAQIRPGYNVTGEEEPTPVVVRLFVPVYSKFQPQFESFCYEIWRDGRYDSLVKILSANVYKDPQCPGCRPLFSTMLAACKAQRAKELKLREKERKQKFAKWKAEQADKPDEPKQAAGEGDEADGEAEPVPTGPPPDPSPTPLYQQREPRAEAVAAASDAFEAIFAVEKGREESLKALKRIISIFRRAEGFTAGEKDYYNNLAAYMFAPFKEYEETLPRDSLEADDFEDNPGGIGTPAPLDDFFGS